MNTQEERFEERKYDRREVLGAGLAVGAGLLAAGALPERAARSEAARSYKATASGAWKYAVVPPVVNPFYLPFPGAIKVAEASFHTGPTRTSSQAPSRRTQRTSWWTALPQRATT